MRVTANSILRNYKNRLNKSYYNLSTKRDHVLSGQAFNTASENVGAATKAYRLRTQYYNNEQYLTNITSLDGILKQQEDIVISANKIGQQIQSDILLAQNGTQGPDEREAIVTGFRSYAEGLVQTFNGKLAETYLFNGSNISEPPLELKWDDSKDPSYQLLYRGVDVTTGLDQSGNPVNLDALANEPRYFDLGSGILNVNGEISASTAFDASATALNALGYGTDADGNPKNLICQLLQAADELSKDDANYSFEKVSNIFENLQESTDNVVKFQVDIGVKCNYLEKTKDRYTNAKVTLTENISNVEDADLAEAISDFSWANYAYSAALKVGNSILSNSFIDFMS